MLFKVPNLYNLFCMNQMLHIVFFALKSYSNYFLCLQEVLRESVSKFMAHVHVSVNDMSRLYLNNDRRYNYTTPKTFLGFISLYSKLLTAKHNDLQAKIERLMNGLEKLRTTSAQVCVFSFIRRLVKITVELKGKL